MSEPSANYPTVREYEPPGTWRLGRLLALKALAPIERVLRIEAASGVFLLLAAAAALIWANSPWRDSWAALFHAPLGLRVGPWAFERDLHFWINEALMTVFFFVVGLEIRREIHGGELSELKRAALPLAAAVGGMVAPAGIYLLLNGGPTSRGWGVPMATDIAFAVGVLALLGRRVPAALRVLLLALAVIDDVGSILVIALFYSSQLSFEGFAVSALGLAAIFAMQRFGVRSALAYVAPGAVVWAGFYQAGIHPTLAGVIIGLLTPVAAGLGREHFLKTTHASVAALEDQRFQDSHGLLPHLKNLNLARREALSPVERLQHQLHGWVAFGVMPLFALANAGVPLGQISLEGQSLKVFTGVLLGLLLGKPLGIIAVSWLCNRLGLAALPRGIGLRQLLVLGLVAGIGFTMSIFIAQLAFTAPEHLEAAKLSILVASFGAATLGLLAGRVLLGKTASPLAAKTAEEAERSTEA